MAIMLFSNKPHGIQIVPKEARNFEKEKGIKSFNISQII